jgi:exopolysaccharide biosynthesis polyprenyl glycosylphosphotransferase
MGRIAKKALDLAETSGIQLRLVPDLHQGVAWRNPNECIDRFPATLPQRRAIGGISLLVKRGTDILISGLTLLLLLPLLLVISIAIKLDSTGPVLYSSERLGKKGQVFRCFKFRSMICDADKHRAEIMHLNERDGVLFKVSNDPRTTKVGRILRRYSIDELPQFVNVLRGDMSIVGPRPALAGEVRNYKATHLRRFDVIPGITGLWQVQARQDPSFDSYISLDLSYIDNWSIWLDLKIIMRTISVVLSGTGS